jgi:4-alpha-glucanotransferase
MNQRECCDKIAGPTRGGGVLMHLTSLPTSFGIGDLGPIAHNWIDLLACSSQRWWQILPVHPPEGHNSPYQSLSAFAGNPLLISPELLVRDNWLARDQLPGAVAASDLVNYPAVIASKTRMLNRAFDRYRTSASSIQRAEFEAFRRQESDWLDDYSLFMALRDAQQATPWQTWPNDLARRRPSALKDAQRTLSGAIEQHQFIQFLFFAQLAELRAHAKSRGVELIGDLPIFVSLQSADVWTSPHLFQLDKNLNPTASAGVPPDAFSKNGQSWGNPLYDWQRMEREHFAWWVRRLRAAIRMTDLVRLDHFRGFQAYWRIPAGSKTAREGRWVKAPGERLFATLRRELGDLPVIAEDLGMITDQVHRLRDQFGLPGMRVLQFAFGGDADNPHLPHNFVPNSVVYTATHDNDTTASWHAKLNAAGREQFRQYAGTTRTPTDAAWALIRLAWGSVSQRAIVPVQDLLGLGNDARMNYPGRAKGNWRWRLPNLRKCEKPLQRLSQLNALFGRSPPRRRKPGNSHLAGTRPPP